MPLLIPPGLSFPERDFNDRIQSAESAFDAAGRRRRHFRHIGRPQIPVTGNH